MISFELKFDLPPGTSAISKLPALIQANVFQALIQGMVYAQTVSQEKYLSGPRPERLGVVTGLLRSSVKAGAQLGGGAGIFAIGVLRAGYGGAAIKYAAIHELGGTTSAHRITPRNRIALKFFWKKANIWRYAKSVNHPGSVIPARPYLRPAFEESLPRVKMLIQAAIDKAYRDS